MLLSQKMFLIQWTVCRHLNEVFKPFLRNRQLISSLVTRKRQIMPGMCKECKYLLTSDVNTSILIRMIIESKLATSIIQVLYASP